MQPIAEGSGAVFTLNVPANRFTTGDYMLTLQGAAGGGELDDLSQSLFRVEKKLSRTSPDRRSSTAPP